MEASRMAPKLSVSDFVAVINQTLEYAYPLVEVEGEVASFKTNQGKYVFFDLKDESASVGCFMMIFQLRFPIEDGMKVVVTAAPKLTQWGKFSLTVRSITPSGEGSIKKSFEILKNKLEREGLFSHERKRKLPMMPGHIAVISSMQAAGYADFIKIINDRWSGLRIDVASVAVQGNGAPDQIIRALEYFNSEKNMPQVIAIIRGGGSADDLSTFNDEKLVRAIAASRIPTLTGIGHEVDISLSDLVADVRASTPSNAAQIIVPDKKEIIYSLKIQLKTLTLHSTKKIEFVQEKIKDYIDNASKIALRSIESQEKYIEHIRRLLNELDPQRVLQRGYALIRGRQAVGETIEVETQNAIMKAKVDKYEQK